jgi:hypothetical protein
MIINDNAELDEDEEDIDDVDDDNDEDYSFEHERVY